MTHCYAWGVDGPAAGPDAVYGERRLVVAALAWRAVRGAERARRPSTPSTGRTTSTTASATRAGLHAPRRDQRRERRPPGTTTSRSRSASAARTRSRRRRRCRDITDDVTIDATTQTGYAGAPLITLAGWNLGATDPGLYVNSGAPATIEGLAITRFGGSGIMLEADTGGSFIKRNYIGLDSNGSTPQPNGIGIDELDSDAIERMADAARRGPRARRPAVLPRRRRQRRQLLARGQRLPQDRRLRGLRADRQRVGADRAHQRRGLGDACSSSGCKVSRLRTEDALFVFSVGGGNLEKNVSPNLVRALQLRASEVGAAIVGVVGRDGGYTAQGRRRVRDRSRRSIRDTVTPHSEAFQAVVWHLLVSHPEAQGARRRSGSRRSRDAGTVRSSSIATA